MGLLSWLGSLWDVATSFLYGGIAKDGNACRDASDLHSESQITDPSPEDFSGLNQTERLARVTDLQKKCNQDPDNIQCRTQLFYAVAKTGKFPTDLQLDTSLIECPDRRIHGLGRVADVYRGKFNGHEVAIKHLRAFHMVQPSQRPALVQAFFEEGVKWKNFNHANVLPFFGIIESAELGGFCMVTPWRSNGTIRHYVQHYEQNGQTLQRFVANAILDIAKGLSYLHSLGVVHGDLRGVNILVCDNCQVQISDCGVNKITEQARDYPNTDQSGTAPWQGPELFDPERFGMELSIPSQATDIYAFAMVCIELHTRQNPFPGQREIRIVNSVLKGVRPPRPTESGQEMTDNLWELVTRSWAEKPNTRPSARELVDKLDPP